jgi:DNA polymerase-1
MAKIVKPATIDFETMPIAAWPDYPPKPVGVSIMLPGDRKPKYLAWGHPCENNCTKDDARRALESIWASKDSILCHHAKFDLDVAETHLGLRLPPWERIHDTMFLLFLNDPHSELKLKPAAERLLNMPPDEQDAILQWAIDNKLLPRNAKKAGHLICKAPGKLVGKYADGDVIRTIKLFTMLYPVIMERGMGEAYDRERRLLPVLLKNEREGIRTDTDVMRADDAKYAKAQLDADAWLRKTLKAKDLNVDSDAELADALVKSKAADPELFLLTGKGNRSVAKDSLLGAVTNPKVLTVLQYRSKLSTAYGTFLKPWLAESEANGGMVHPSWNQVRQSGSMGDAGARTGRLSASRFMNVPKRFEEEEGKYMHPTYAKLPQLPQLRGYMLPDKGHVWVKRDYSQQELRVLGHFEDGVLMEKFLADPTVDIHQLAGDMLITMGFFDGNRKRARKACKTLGFGLLYGMGLGSLAERLDTDVGNAKVIKGAYMDIFPGLKDLQDNLKKRAQQNLPLRTWGGREYYVEPPKYSEKHRRMQSFEYKLLNYLIQGSSADCTKEAVIRYDAAKKDGRFLVMVHDEINISVPPKAMEAEAKLLREIMASIEFDIPMRSDCGFGDSWASLKPLEETE